MKRKYTDKDILAITWHDASSRQGWLKPTSYTPFEAVTVGHFVSQSKDHMTVCASICYEDDFTHYADHMTIPKGMIKKIKHLGTKKVKYV